MQYALAGFVGLFGVRPATKQPLNSALGLRANATGPRDECLGTPVLDPLVSAGQVVFELATFDWRLFLGRFGAKLQFDHG